MVSHWKRDRHRGLRWTCAGLWCRRGETLFQLTVDCLNYFPVWFCSLLLKEIKILLSSIPCLTCCGMCCLSAANLRAQSWWVDTLRQDAGWNQREQRWSWGTCQRLMSQTPTLTTANTFLSSTQSTYSTLHDIARGACFLSLWSLSFSTYYNMNWPEEMCRARMARWQLYFFSLCF